MGATQMFYRPNYMHNGGNMPYSSAKRMADDMNFAYAHGMIAIDQDSLNGAWSAQAMKNYVAARVLREPDATYGKMSAEFYSAFGGYNGSLGARDSFELTIPEDCREIYFYRDGQAGGEYDLVLRRDNASSDWERVQP